MQSSLIKRVLVFVVYCSVVSSSVPVAAAAGTIQGRVSDSAGAAIKGAHILFHLDSSGQTKSASTVAIVRETDAIGHFDVQLQPGFYDVCIMGTAFTPECRKLLVSKDGGHTQHNARLNSDPLVIKHLGDKF